MINVAFLGPLGTYTHQAVLQQFPDDGNTQYTALKTIPQCFQELTNDLALDYAVVPLENSTNGQVVFTYDILRDLMNECADHMQNQALPKLEIVAEQYVAIDLCLISSEALDIEALGNDTCLKIYSHPQVWGQATGYLDRLRQRVHSLQMIDTTSTSGAVRYCCEKKGLDAPNEIRLAIASSTAAKMHGAFILDSPINDKKGNTTRFLVLRRSDSQRGPLLAQPSVASTSDQQVSLLTFVVTQDAPGSLVDVLNVLKENQINMCSISSRPYHHPDDSKTRLQGESTGARRRKWQYVFFIEVNHDSAVNWAPVVTGLSSKSLRFCFWGTFSRNRRYYEMT
ncbi:LAME_0B03510g1_1 [Lachancea meyersii CBS 8951]|uniref:prephenate dehydratase n=1 Tax=Lachancea meyersii CBS 8951 TaxID=1266667 RepID=A0A1G4IUD8_9SACH|nr:LAME_0B03510g1_1 [Lachancea meyersii CBS 8951]